MTSNISDSENELLLLVFSNEVAAHVLRTCSCDIPSNICGCVEGAIETLGLSFTSLVNIDSEIPDSSKRGYPSMVVDKMQKIVGALGTCQNISTKNSGKLPSMFSQNLIDLFETFSDTLISNDDIDWNPSIFCNMSWTLGVSILKEIEWGYPLPTTLSWDSLLQPDSIWSTLNGYPQSNSVEISLKLLGIIPMMLQKVYSKISSRRKTYIIVASIAHFCAGLLGVIQYSSVISCLDNLNSSEQSGSLTSTHVLHLLKFLISMTEEVLYFLHTTFTSKNYQNESPAFELRLSQPCDYSRYIFIAILCRSHGSTPVTSADISTPDDPVGVLSLVSSISSKLLRITSMERPFHGKIGIPPSVFTESSIEALYQLLSNVGKIHSVVKSIIYM